MCDEAGTVTAELAIGLTSITIALGAVLSTVSLGAAQLSASGAAHAVARAAARGETAPQARLLGLRLAGEQARVGISRGSEMTQVTVRRRLPLMLPGRPVVTIRASATALTEEPS